MYRMERKYRGVRAGDKDRVFFRHHRSAQDILREAQTPFNEFVDSMPPLQMGMFNPVDIEEDCGAGCEIT